MKIPKKIKLPDGTKIYLAKCPKCGEKRSLNKDKAATYAAVTGAGILSTIALGGPVVGLFAVVGIIKLVAAGVISGGIAARYLQANYKYLEELGRKKWFICDDRGCGDLFR